MTLVWKLLRRHISIAQFTGFFLANLVGMAIIMLGIQFYTDTQSIYDGEDTFMKADYLIVNRKVGAMTTLTGKANAFSPADIEDLRAQPFVQQVGTFTPCAFDVRASFDIEGFANITTDMFFESVPDAFVDVSSDMWNYHEGDTEIPIILPKNYLDLYNFGYAQSRGMPKLSEGIIGAIKLNIRISGNQKQALCSGRIAGFSSRLNTILVPEAFMRWANKEYASSQAPAPTRLILQVNNPTDDRIATYLQQHNYETDQDKLNASKTTYILRIVTAIVMTVGLIIAMLAFYILMLSVYLLVQKNSTKLENLLLIGYSPAKVSLPYQMLTVLLNALVFLIAVAVLLMARNVYLDTFQNLFPRMQVPSLWPSLLTGTLLFLLVSVLNIIAVKNKVMSIWNRKD